MNSEPEAIPRGSIRDHYAAIDVHHGGPAWPAPLPALTAPEAIRAARRLYRWALGSTFRGNVAITTGNRSNDIRWDGNVLTIFVNPSRGWDNFAHELSHDFWYRANPGERPHSKHHARFEAKLVREIIRRGWLDGKLRDKPAPAIAPDDAKRAKQRAELARIDAAVERWERKAKRAKNALAKLAKRRRYYAKALGES